MTPLQVYQQYKKNITEHDNLPHRQSTTSTEVFELLIALRKGTRSFTQHPIDNVVSFSHLSSRYFSFSIKLSSVSLAKS